ncbi:hypothetical protein LX36DRAFT_30078 [Colletotrichum falcatum]|nr:hypothetical protein LX36DRAFT_30078 [Colletotrichum falcatum]
MRFDPPPRFEIGQIRKIFTSRSNLPLGICSALFISLQNVQRIHRSMTSCSARSRWFVSFCLLCALIALALFCIGRGRHVRDNHTANKTGFPLPSYAWGAMSLQPSILPAQRPQGGGANSIREDVCLWPKDKARGITVHGAYGLVVSIRQPASHTFGRPTTQWVLLQ